MEDNDYVKVFQLLEMIKCECGRNSNYVAELCVNELIDLLRNKFVLWKNQILSIIIF